MKKSQIFQLVQEEVQKMIKEAKDNAPKMNEKLESLRVKLEDSMDVTESLGNELLGPNRRQKRVQLATVAEILDVPVNELMLHFMNEVKASNERHLVEYHLGMVYFYASK
jgi:hypothetical protein